MQLINTSKNALFFELDGVIRRLHPEVRKLYIAEHGMAPPAPGALGQQDIIEPVAIWIADYCERTGAIPIGLDQAPYLSTLVPETGLPILDKREYELILVELRVMLADYGVKDTRFLYCDHAAREEVIVDSEGKVASKFHATCECRYPGRALVERAVDRYDLHHYRKDGQFRVFSPSQMVVGGKDARDMSIDGCAMETQWAEAIITGRVGLKDRATHAHLKVAAQLREHQHDHLGHGLNPNQVIDVDARSFNDIADLPPELDKPLAP